jgi:cell wall-associated NlpC family hydrolase
MVEYYFTDKEKQKELKTILESWLNTPYKHHTGVKGMGCDCIHFVGCVMEEMGLLNFDRKSVPQYPRDWHLHNTREILSEGIEARLNVEKLNINDKLINGDIILSHYGKASSHAGIFFDNYVYQALDGIGVRKIIFTDQKFKKQMKFFYRILK